MLVDARATGFTELLKQSSQLFHLARKGGQRLGCKLLVFGLVSKFHALVVKIDDVLILSLEDLGASSACLETIPKWGKPNAC